MSRSALIVASALTACTPAPEPEPPAFEIVARTYREGFATNPTTSALLRERATGCLYSLAEGEGATPIMLPDGRQAGCVNG